MSSSAATCPSEGTSSDSCLPFSASEGPVGLGGGLATPGLLGTSSPVRLASPFLGSHSATPVLQAQAGLGTAVLLPVSFQEGRRASDTSLTQGKVPFCVRPHASATVWQAISVLDGSCVPPPSSAGPLVLLRQTERTALTLGSLGYRVDSDLTLRARGNHSGQQLLPDRLRSRRDPDKGSPIPVWVSPCLSGSGSGVPVKSPMSVIVQGIPRAQCVTRPLLRSISRHTCPIGEGPTAPPRKTDWS